IVVITIVWMASGMMGTAESDSPAEETTTGDSAPGSALLTRVKVRSFNAEDVVQEVIAQGKSYPGRSVTIKAETRGRVVFLGAEKGAGIAEGATIIKLEQSERTSRLSEASAMVEQRWLEYRASQSLQAKGLKSDSQMAEALSLLRSAQARKKEIEIDIERTDLRAPFAGHLEERLVEVGSYLNVGEPVATVIDVEPFIVAGDLSEKEVTNLEIGQKGYAILTGDVRVDGTLRYIANSADPQSRTYHFELEIPNSPVSVNRMGLSAEIHLPIRTVKAHRLTPAMLSLNDEGDIGVKGVDSGGLVTFYPITIARSEADGFWVTGPPQQVELITVGQGFVRAGDRVETTVDAAE
ncbi:MAG: efflux RND transporter periplasmic adaptor subunit, partial [Gammaproteobacteria bacterium]|nr:efflux RND transporter periplasmic adaptor subunit [Gammaproteobacteria bacterium]